MKTRRGRAGQTDEKLRLHLVSALTFRYLCKLNKHGKEPTKMWILIISLIALALVAAALGAARYHRLQQRVDRGELDALPQVKEVDSECCGQHEVCEKESLLAAVSRQIEYYDDEELDRYIGTAPDAYTAEQEDEFRDVFYTMRSEDVAGWVRSLQLRGIALPDNLKDEVFLIVGERRGL